MRVLMIIEHMLFGDVLEILLSSQFLVCRYRVTNAALDGLLERVNHYRPEVVVVEAELEVINIIRQSLANSVARIIYVHPQKNEVQIQGEGAVSLTRAADLFSIMDIGVNKPLVGEYGGAMVNYRGYGDFPAEPRPQRCG